MLSVLGVIAVMGGIALPASRAALEFARSVRTQAQFAQWTAALELHRADLRKLAVLGAGGLLDSERFAAALTGRDSLARELADDRLNGNVRRRRFMALVPGDWLRLEAPTARAVVVDAFGNSDIGVLYDRDGDGWIRDDERVLPSLRPGNARDGFGEAINALGDRAPEPNGLRARIVFVSVGAGGQREAIWSGH
ncbi:MAG: hypothetical protein ACK5CF_00740 [Opitutaceae bacterium]